jgi:hypothetical protein
VTALMLAYAHPFVGGTALAFLCYVASLGLRTRGRRQGRAALAARHARLAPIAYALVVASWVFGFLSAWLLRPDLGDPGTLHWQSGTLVVVLLTGSALSARWMRRGSSAGRDLHPWFGAAALLLAAAQVVTGLRIMP